MTVIICPSPRASSSSRLSPALKLSGSSSFRIQARLLSFASPLPQRIFFSLLRFGSNWPPHPSSGQSENAWTHGFFFFVVAVFLPCGCGLTTAGNANAKRANAKTNRFIGHGLLLARRIALGNSASSEGTNPVVAAGLEINAPVAFFRGPYVLGV